MNLWEYSGKKLKITGTSGRTFVGFGDYYTSELDNPDGVAALSLKPDNTKGLLIEFEEPEIASIEIIHDEIPAVPYRAVMREAV